MNSKINIDLTPIWFIFQFAFIILKLTNSVTWSWWVVLIPTWVTVIVFIILIITILIIKKKITNKY